MGIEWTIEATDKENLTRENLDIPRKGNLKGDAGSLLIAIQNNAIRTNYDKPKIDTMQ